MSALNLTENFLAKPVLTSKTLGLQWGDIVVLAAAILVNLISFVGGTLLFMPDSGNYVIGAISLVNDGDLYMDAVRPPGYSIFLAFFFALLGSSFLFWATLAQHILLIIIALIIKRLTYALVPITWVAILAGLFSAFGLQLVSYANFPMSEVLYASLSTISIYLIVTFTRTGSTRYLLAGVAAISFGALVRPSGLYFPLFIIALATARLIFARGHTSWQNWKPVVFATAIFAAIAGPPMLHNLTTQGHFKLVGNLGQNLYSNTVEYGGFWDPDSPAIQDIRARFDEWAAAKRANGEKVPDNITWRNHWPATTAYLDMTNKSLWDGDAIFLEAAMDSIKAQPGRFIVHLLQNLKITFLYAEPTYRYMPDYFYEGNEKPWHMPSALPLEWPDESRARLARVIEGRGDVPSNPAQFSEPTVLTPLYGLMSRAYHRLISNYATFYALISILGLVYAAWRLYRTRDPAWLTMLVAFAYFGLLPLLVVPGSPRHRLPVDPLMATFAAIGFLSLLKGACRILPEIPAFAFAGGTAGDADDLRLKTEYLLHENRNLAATVRYLRAAVEADDPLARQTRASFDFQWEKLPTGRHNLEHPLFREEAPGYVCEYTGFPAEWFKGKKAIDVGCGAGRYSFALSVLGADVLSVDQSTHGLARAAEACRGFPAHRTKTVNLLKTLDIEETFDLVWSYGVLHHTGDTYGAFQRVVPLVKPGGWIFLMLYGLPREGYADDFEAVNEYERWRVETRNMSFDEKLERLIEASTDGTLRAQGVENLEGYFDAISPAINDLYSWVEIETWLLDAGFVDIKRTIDTRNHHLVARRPETSAERDDRGEILQ